jgi:hypothetical protein
MQNQADPLDAPVDVNKGEMSEGSEGLPACDHQYSGSENIGVGSCAAIDVRSSPQDDRGCSKSEVCEVEGGAEEGGVAG